MSATYEVIFIKNNITKSRHYQSNIKIIESAFGNRLLTYRIIPTNQELSRHPVYFVTQLKTQNNLVDESLKKLFSK